MHPNIYIFLQSSGPFKNQVTKSLMTKDISRRIHFLFIHKDDKWWSYELGKSFVEHKAGVRVDFLYMWYIHQINFFDTSISFYWMWCQILRLLYNTKSKQEKKPFQMESTKIVFFFEVVNIMCQMCLCKIGVTPNVPTTNITTGCLVCLSCAAHLNSIDLGNLEMNKEVRHNVTAREDFFLTDTHPKSGCLFIDSYTIHDFCWIMQKCRSWRKKSIMGLSE